MLIPGWAPVLIKAPDSTTTSVPEAVPGPLPTVTPWVLPAAQVITAPLVEQAAAAAPPKPSEAAARAICRIAKRWDGLAFEGDDGLTLRVADLPAPDASSEATAQTWSEEFQTTLKTRFMQLLFQKMKRPKAK
jgi:hypothetical protein